MKGVDYAKKPKPNAEATNDSETNSFLLFKMLASILSTRITP